MHLIMQQQQQLWQYSRLDKALLLSVGDCHKVGMGVCSRTTTIFLMQHPQATPAYISLHVVYNLY